MASYEVRPSTWCVRSSAAGSPAAAGAAARRPRRFAAVYPMNADASKARDAISAVRSRHRRSAADALSARRESGSLLASSRAQFDSLLRAFAGGYAKAPPPLPPPPPQRRVALPPSPSSGGAASGRTGPTPGGSPIYAHGDGRRSPLADCRRPSAGFRLAADDDARTSSSTIDSWIRAVVQKYSLLYRVDAASDGARTAHFRPVNCASSELSVCAAGSATVAGDCCGAAWPGGVWAGRLAGFAPEVTYGGGGGCADSSDQPTELAMRDGLSLVPHLVDKDVGRVPVTRMYRDRPSLTREQARKLKLIAKLEDRELDSLKPATTAAAALPGAAASAATSDDDSQLSSDRSQAGSRSGSARERHWVDDITVSSRSDDAGEGIVAAAEATALQSTAEDLRPSRDLPPCICPSSEEKSRLFCVKIWLMSTNFDKCSKAIPLL